jgi:hypothetical protein
MTAAYGNLETLIRMMGEEPSYLHFVQLELNLPRVKLQPALAVGQGVGAAKAERLSFAWADAAETDPAKARRTHSSWTRARMMAKMLARAK